MQRTWETLRRAVLVLVGPGTCKQRLIDAYLGHLSKLNSVDLPESAAVQFDGLITALKGGQPTGGLCGAEVAVRKMSEADASRYSECVLDCFVALSAQRAQEAEAPAPPRLRVVGEANDGDVPAFLSRA
jgi:hypothetical protein